jgi:predicted ATPase
MSRGGARVTPYAFSFALPKQGDEEAPHVTLQFRVAPETKPPTNVHVLIGRNGVGKTRLLNLMTKALLATKTPSPDVGEFTWEQGSDGCQRFANLVNVSFSAFDSKDIPPIQSALSGELKHSYIGLRLSPDGQTSSSAPKCAAALADEFVASLRVCQVEPLRKRWLTAMATLESDPVFQQATLTELCSLDLTTDDGKDNAVGTFDRLSSGHKIVLLTVTRLVEAVEEQTLVLVDEIEAHLHPPLLSSFVRALSSLLLDRNGVAIVATHSPVVLQEVPKLCAWVLSRSGSVTKAERPSIETFGENVGILTREVFQLELSQSGFHQLLADVAKEHGSYEAALSFGLKEQLGAEGRAVLRAIFLSKTQGGQ